MLKQSTIIINGQIMPEAAAMTIRVALDFFAMDLNGDELEDEIGRSSAEAYLKNIKYIRMYL